MFPPRKVLYVKAAASAEAGRVVPGCAVGVLAALLLALSTGVASSNTGFVTIGTGGPTGIYFVAGNSICRMLHRARLPESERVGGAAIRCAAPSTPGSAYNVFNIREGEFDFGITQSDLQHLAYHGAGLFEGARFEGLRSVFSMHAEPFQLVVAKDSRIERWLDLRGKRVGVGNQGSGQNATIQVLLAAHGMSAEDLGEARGMTSTEQPRALCSGLIDAYAYTVGVPDAGVSVATDGCGARIVGLDGEVAKRLVEDEPFYFTVTIPKGTYRTTVREVTTFGVLATLVTSADQPDDVVYALVRAVFDNLDEFKELHPAFVDLDPKRMIREGLSAPLHPGAAKYYRERGWM